jgi:hypothetical protein
MLKCRPDMPPPAVRGLTVARLHVGACELYLYLRRALSGPRRSRLRRLVGGSWQMYPAGLLFELGFDTASEVVLPAMSAAAAAGNLPVPAALSLPIRFASGMSPVDTTSAAATAFQGCNGGSSILGDQQAPLPAYGVCGCKFLPQEVACGSLPKECR